MSRLTELINTAERIQGIEPKLNLPVIKRWVEQVNQSSSSDREALIIHLVRQVWLRSLLEIFNGSTDDVELKLYALSVAADMNQAEVFSWILGGGHFDLNKIATIAVRKGYLSIFKLCLRYSVKPLTSKNDDLLIQIVEQDRLHMLQCLIESQPPELQRKIKRAQQFAHYLSRYTIQEYLSRL